MDKENIIMRSGTEDYSVEKWIQIINEDCFSPILMEAIYTLIFEMNGEGAASQISRITGRKFQSYNHAPATTVKNLRKRGYDLPTYIREYSSTERFWSHFFNGYQDIEKDVFVWIVKDNLKEAVLITENRTQELGDAILDNENGVIEGASKLKIHKMIERSPSIVRCSKEEFKKRRGKLRCEACDFSFNEIYGIDYIEAHHILPINQGERNTLTSDLVMLCANCHRAIHNKKWDDKTLDDFIDEVKSNYKR